MKITALIKSGAHQFYFINKIHRELGIDSVIIEDKNRGNMPAFKKLKAKMPAFAHALGVPNQEHGQGMMANYRTAGLADMALAIQEGRPHRCSLEMSLHVVDVMVSVLKAGETGRAVSPSTTCERPAFLDKKEARSMLAPKPRAKK